MDCNTKRLCRRWHPWQVGHPKVANAIVAFAKAVSSNRQLSTKVGGVLAKLLHI